MPEDEVVLGGGEGFGIGLDFVLVDIFKAPFGKITVFTNSLFVYPLKTDVTIGKSLRDASVKESKEPQRNSVGKANLHVVPDHVGILGSLDLTIPFLLSADLK